MCSASGSYIPQDFASTDLLTSHQEHASACLRQAPTNQRAPALAAAEGSPEVPRTTDGQRRGARAGAQRAAAEEEGRAARADAERLRRQLAEAAATSDLDRQFKEVPAARAPSAGWPHSTAGALQGSAHAAMRRLCLQPAARATMQQQQQTSRCIDADLVRPASGPCCVTVATKGEYLSREGESGEPGARARMITELDLVRAAAQHSQ